MPTSPAASLMERAFELAEKGRYTVSPNPMVGAVLARGGKIIGEGFHQRAGGPHAEVLALREAGTRAQGADLYVTLEPCAHFGKTPPCTEAILSAGVARIITAAGDPNPKVQGRGLRALKARGIEVLRGTLSDKRRAEIQNEKFRVWVSERRPFVLAKWAATLDGKTATGSGRSRWITGRAARLRALLFREEYDAVLVGAGTVGTDDPLLTRRLAKNRANPHWRVVLDGRLRVPQNARLFKEPASVIVATALPEEDPRFRRLAARGALVWSVPGSREGSVSIRRLLSRLARQGVTSLMVEGGAKTLWSFFRSGLVDRVAVFMAPRILGGESAPGGVGGDGFALESAPEIVDVERQDLGRDWLVTGRVVAG